MARRNIIPLKVIPPVTITNSNMTSNVTEADYPQWSAATTYVVGDRVIVTTAHPTVHRIYESLRASNLNHDPTTDTTTPPYWLDIGPTNRWAMFDTVNSTQTSNATSIVVTITPGTVVNTVALLNLDAVSIRIKVTDPTDGVVYDRTTNLNDNGTIIDWYQYFFTPIMRKTDYVATDLPSYGSASIEITISNPSNPAKCGTCLIGNTKYLGEGINLGASVGITDYSRKERDQFGNLVFVQRSYSKRAKFTMAVPNTQIDGLEVFLASIRSQACLWVGDERYTSTIIYGFYKDFDILINNHTVSDCSLEIEGLT